MRGFFLHLMRAWSRAPLYGWRRALGRAVAWPLRLVFVRTPAAVSRFGATHPVMFLLLSLSAGLAAAGWMHREQVTWVIKKEYDRAAVVVRPFEVPESLARQGYTGTVLVERLLDEIQKIRDEQNSQIFNIGRFRENGLSVEIPDKFRSSMETYSLNIPAMDTDFLQTMRFIRQIRGDEIITLAGEAHCPSATDCKPDDMRLTLRLLKSAVQDAPSFDNEINVLLVRLRGAIPTEKRRYLLQAFEPGDKGLSATLRGGAMALLEVIDPLLFAAQVYLKQDFHNDQQRRADTAVEKADKNPFARQSRELKINKENSSFVFAKWLYYLDRPADALPFADREAEAIGAGYEAIKMRGDIKNDMKDFTGAIADYDRAIGIEGNMASIYFNRGNSLSFLQRYEDALASYNKAIEIDPKYARAYVNRGTLNAYLNNTLQAQQDFITASQLDPAYAYSALYARLLGQWRGNANDAPLRAATEQWRGGDWPKKLAAYLTRDADEMALFAAVPASGPPDEAGGRLCEAHFFVGYQALIAGDTIKARDHFMRVLATNENFYYEYKWAEAELARLGPAPESATAEAAGWWSCLDYVQWAWAQAAAALYPWPGKAAASPNPALESGGVRP